MDATKELTGAENIIWNLADLYVAIDDPNIAKDTEAVQAKADKFGERYRGRVASLTAAELSEALMELETIHDSFGKIANFCGLLWNTDTANPDYGAAMQRSREQGAQLQQKLLFFDLEWANIPDERARITADPTLARWRHYLEKALQMRPYLLSEPEEKILAEKAVTGISAWGRFYGEVLSAQRYDFNGEKVPQEVVLRQMYLPDREARRRAADSLTAGLREMTRTTTYVYNVTLAEKASTDRLRTFPTWISERNLDNEASDDMVDALIAAVTSRYDIVARYYQIKRKLLGLDELFDYDRYAPLEKVETRYQWDEAKQVVLNAFNAFHPQMADIAGEFFDKCWIHAPVQPNKRGGAFASPSVPSVHPWVFVNFMGLGKDVMTLAHELGHGIHMYLSRPKGALEAGTPLTTAEMASVFGEMLVFNDMMKREANPKVRQSMLASKIEDTFATVFRQVSMNRFEDAIHTARRTDGELTTDRYSEFWLKTQRAMFGDSVTLRDDYGIWWSYVNHFIAVPGYVYAYAFGELLVLALFNQYRKQGDSFTPKYLEVLSMGGSDKPENILAKVGVDLTDPAFWKEGLAVIDEMVTQLDTLVTD